MKNNIYDFVIVGGGAAGLAAAALLGRKGKKVLVLEAQSAPARKILLSGNGRCNATNAGVAPDKYYGDKKFVSAVLKHFNTGDCAAFLESMGVLLTQEGEGRFFPVTGKARSVADALLMSAREAGAEIVLNAKVISAIKKDCFELETACGKVYRAQNAALACGSGAYSAAGATADGYALAKSFGHSIIPPAAALCALNLEGKVFAKMQGFKTQAALTLKTEGKTYTEQGEIIFTAAGINGTPAHNLSSPANRSAARQEVSINLFPHLTARAFGALMAKRRALFAGRKLKDFFTGMLTPECTDALLSHLDLAPTILAGRLSDKNFANMIECLQDWRAPLGAGGAVDGAYVCSGGVNCKEVEAGTMRSLIKGGLYLLGEVLDVDGKSGGYNLHFAFACAKILAEGL